MPWAQGNPSGKFFVHLVSRPGSGWLTFVSFSSCIFFQERVLFFQCSKQEICNTGQQQLLGCREIQNTGSASPPTQGRWKIQDKIRKFHFSMKCNSTAIRGGEAGKSEDHTWIENTENPILPSWRRFCLLLNPGFGLGWERQQTNQSEQMFPRRTRGFSGMKVLEGRAVVTGQCTLVRQPGDHSDALKHSQPEILSTWSTSWQHLRAIFVPYPQSPSGVDASLQLHQTVSQVSASWGKAHWNI